MNFCNTPVMTFVWLSINVCIIHLLHIIKIEKDSEQTEGISLQRKFYVRKV